MLWLEGLVTALNGQNLIFLLMGTLYGLVVGALPGLGPSFGVASMIPVSFWMPPDTAIIFLAAIHASTTYGDSIASILINTPGGPGSVATCWDGHPLARQGKAAFALGVSTAGSGLGGIIGWLCLAALSPALARLALLIGPAEYAMVALLALSLLSVAARGETIKGLILGGLGLLLSFVGSDPIAGVDRFTFGIRYLEDGLDLVPVTLGLFALSQTIALAREGARSIVEVMNPTDRVWDGFKEALRYPVTVLRSGIIGIILGVMPALGVATANIVAYLTEKNSSKDQETFGRGNTRGLLAPEVAKNACVVGDLVPTFTLGIPGSSTTAIFLAALLIHGIAPGPWFFQQGVLPYTVFMGILLAQIAFSIAGLFLCRFLAKAVRVPSALLVPCIVVLCFVGAYAVRKEWLDVLVAVLFGVFGFLLDRYRYPVACLVLGLVLGEMFEQNFHRALIISKGSYSIFVTKPIALVMLLVAITFIAWPYLTPLVKRLPSYLLPSQDGD